MLTFLLSLFTLLSIITFFLFGIDKHRAKKGKWRIRVRTLMLFSLFGGALGGLLGMKVFRHKTKTRCFRIGMPLFLLLHLLLLGFVIYTQI